MANDFPKELEGERIVWREAFIEGYQDFEESDDFWQKRGQFITEAYGASMEEYNEKFLSQFNKLLLIRADDVFLWFEDDLFCQVNMWWVIKMLCIRPSSIPFPKLYRVFPEDKPGSWEGFSKSGSHELMQAYQQSVVFEQQDIDLALKLWDQYKSGTSLNADPDEIAACNCFRYLPEIIDAQNDRFPLSGGPGRPERILEDIIFAGKESFEEIFAEFYKRAGVYGFGDMQIYRLLGKMSPAYKIKQG